MRMIAEAALPVGAAGHLRRLDMRRDLAKVADLVELCFYDTLDPEGRQYLNEMRRAAQNTSLLGWASSLIDESPMPPSGYIWEEDSRLVGNLSLIPISWQGRKGYMIANVATHPDYRGRGIAKALTTVALEHAKEHGSASVWLQVRQDNPAAIHIYEVSGFIERLRRTSWYSGPNNPDSKPMPGVRITARQSRHWKLQREWLQQCYPIELTWNIPFDWTMFRPDIWGKLYRTFALDFLQHWSVERDGQLKGVVSWRHSNGFTDPIWLALPQAVDQDAILTLLAESRKAIHKTQPLSLNYPAGEAVEVLKLAGFYAHQTLIWMSIDLNR
ncbi:MAG TPA: N-acetyltransferase [Anaerolineales bacterium]|nr:N-acetyltransferase [Anaerolineales bacterium]